VAALRDADNSVVAWSPSIDGETSIASRFPRLTQAIRELYEPSACFGALEIWRRVASHDGRVGQR